MEQSPNQKAKIIPPHEEVMHNTDFVGMILMYLPILSIIQLKLTCRAWRDLISKEWFADEHTKKNFKDRKVLALYAIRRPVANLCRLSTLPTLWFLLGKPTVSTRTSLRQLARKQKKLNLLMASNGLMLCENDDKLFVINPTTQTSRYIGVTKQSWRISHHISFDPSVSKSYKIVRIITQFNDFYGPASFEIDIYSSTTRRWKDIKIDGVYWPNIRISEVLVDGIIYWITTNDNRLLTFNVENEVMETKQTIFRILRGHICWSGVVNGNWVVVEKDVEISTILHLYRMNWDSYPTWTPIVDVDMNHMIGNMAMETAEPYVLSLKEETDQELPSAIFLINNRIISFNTSNNTLNVVREMQNEGNYDPTEPMDNINAAAKTHKFIPSLANV